MPISISKHIDYLDHRFFEFSLSHTILITRLQSNFHISGFKQGYDIAMVHQRTGDGGANLWLLVVDQPVIDD